MEQLPSDSRSGSPAQVASPVGARGFVSPAAVLRQGQGQLSNPWQGQEQEQSRGQVVAQGLGPGLGQGLHGVGLFARNAAAALCSARRQIAEPRNPYRSATISIVANMFAHLGVMHHQVIPNYTLVIEVTVTMYAKKVSHAPRLTCCSLC